MSTPPADTAGVSRWRRVVATLCGLGAAFFTGLWLLVCGFVLLQIFGRVFEGGELVFAALFLTAPPVVIFTALALWLVGPRRCRLAWISAVLYVSPIAISIIIGMVASLFHWLTS